MKYNKPIKTSEHRKLEPLTVQTLIEKLQTIEDKSKPVLRFNVRGASMDAVQVRTVLRSKGFIAVNDTRIEVDGVELW